MQSSQEPFFTNSADGWMKVATFLLLTVASSVISVYTFLRKRWSTDTKLRTDIDGVGGRVAILETKTTTHDAELIRAKEFEQLETMQRGMLEAKIAALEKSHENIERAVTGGVKAMTEEVRKMEQLFTREHQELRERVVRLETMSKYGVGKE